MRKRTVKVYLEYSLSVIGVVMSSGSSVVTWIELVEITAHRNVMEDPS